MGRGSLRCAGASLDDVGRSGRRWGYKEVPVELGLLGMRKKSVVMRVCTLVCHPTS